jgi:NAD-dependent oxidoreductase involved in siderophore biosynthesis
VNGNPVGNVESDRAELAGVLAQGSARIEIQRGSRRFFVNTSLEK